MNVARSTLQRQALEYDKSELPQLHYSRIFALRKTAMAAPCFLLANTVKYRTPPSQFYVLGIIPYPPQWYRSPKLQQSMSREPLDIWICHFHTGSRTPTSLDTDEFQIDLKILN
jgi:hypothetical protein